LIRSFKDKDTESVFRQRWVRKLHPIAGVALRKLVQIDSAEELRDLKGNRAGQYSIRINDRYRVCFRWKNGHAYDVGIADYH